MGATEKSGPDLDPDPHWIKKWYSTDSDLPCTLPPPPISAIDTVLWPACLGAEPGSCWTSAHFYRRRARRWRRSPPPPCPWRGRPAPCRQTADPRSRRRAAAPDSPGSQRPSWCTWNSRRLLAPDQNKWIQIYKIVLLLETKRKKSK